MSQGVFFLVGYGGATCHFILSNFVNYKILHYCEA